MNHPGRRTNTSPSLISRAVGAGVITCSIAVTASAQSPVTKATFDTAYVSDYSHQVTARVFSSTKYNAFFIASQDYPDLVYRPNNRINLGIGASYRALTLNLGFGFAALNNDNAVRGKTRYVDAQANIHTQRWATNLFLQVFGGYYISSHDMEQVGWVQDTERPYRADVSQFNLGASALRILNDRRFSYRASFNQDAWQRKSQGSWLLGGYLTYYNIHADSSLIPSRLFAQFDDLDRIRRGSFLDIGPLGGYAYTYVLKEHWFLTVSAAVGAGLGAQWIIVAGSAGQALPNVMGFGVHGQLRSGVGYNSRRDQVGLSFNQENIGYPLSVHEGFRWNVGNVRLNFAHRFNVRLRAADRGIRWFQKKVLEPVKALP